MFAEAHLYLGVALAGLVSFLSPCVLPLVPPYLGYLGGTSMEQLTAEDGLEAHVWRRVVLASLFFVLGFTTVFVALGASASLMGQLILTYRAELAVLAGNIIVLFGLHFLGVLRVPLLYIEARYHFGMSAASYAEAYVIGLAFAFGWTPCIGPILATVLALAANEASLGAGVRLLTVYSLGLGVPFVLAAVAIRPFLSFMGRFRRHLGAVEKVMGVMLVLTGLLFLGDFSGTLRNWAFETSPALVGWRGFLGLLVVAVGVFGLLREEGWARWVGLLGVILGMQVLGGSINAFGQWLIETFPALGQVEAWVTPEGLQDELRKHAPGG